MTNRKNQSLSFLDIMTNRKNQSLSDIMPNDPTVGTPKESGWSVRMVFVTAVSFLVVPALTYNGVCLNAPSEIIKIFMNETELGRTGYPLEQSSVDSLYGLLVAVVGLGSAIGSLTANGLSDLVGKKNALTISCLTGSVGVLLMALCTVGSSYEMLFLGRAICGFATGWAFTFAPTYNMEMCLPHQKGAIAMVMTIAQSSAIVFAQVCGYEELLGNNEYWCYLIGLPLVLLTLQILLMPFCPHNPRYLLINRKDETGAVKVLQLIRGCDEVTNEIKQIRHEMAESDSQTQISIYQMFTTPTMRRPLIVAIVMGLYFNWSGIISILLFSGTLFKSVGVTERSSRYATSGTGAVFLLGNIIAAFLMPHFGRKTIFVIGTGAMSVFTAVFALTFIFQETMEFLKYVNIAVALLIVASFSIGPVCVFWVIMGEMFPHNSRAAGFAVAIMCMFAGFFVHCYALPDMMKTMSSYMFFVFCGINAGMVAFSVLYLPETKNKTFEEISKSWVKAKDNDNHVQSSSV